MQLVIQKVRSLLLPFLLLSLAFLLEAMLRSCFNSIFHILLQQFSSHQIGEMASAFFVTYAIMQLFTGYLLDNYSIRLIISIALLIVTMGVLMLMSDSYIMMLLARLLIGIGSSGIFLSGSYFIQSKFPNQYAAFFMGLYICIGFLGGFLANYPFLQLVKWVGLHVAWMVCAVVSLLLFISVTWVLKNEKGVRKQKQKYFLPLSQFPWQDYWQLIVLGISAACIDIVTGVFGGLWGSHFLETMKHLSVSQASLISSLTFVGYMLGAPFFGYYYSKIKNIYPYIAFYALIIAGLFYVLIAIITQLWSIAFLIFCLGFLAGQNIYAFRIPFMLSKQYSGLYLSIVNFIIMMSTALFDILVPRISEWTDSVDSATYIFSIAALISSCLILALIRHASVKNLVK